MKRWITILGRGGTTLVAVSLALLLVSVVPQLQYSSDGGNTTFSPEQIEVMFTTTEFTPQQELEVTVTVEGALKVYLLDMSVQFQFFNGGGYAFELSELQEFLENHSEGIIWEYDIENGTFSRTYTPTRVMNATVIFYNPNPETAQAEHYVSLKSSLAPANKVQNIVIFGAPIGILLALPWLLNLWKQKEHKIDVSR